jgi:hypothetical protein
MVCCTKVLALALAVGLVACSSSAPPRRATGGTGQPMLMTRAPARVVPAGDEPRVRQAAAAELGPEAASEMTAMHPASAPADATAVAGGPIDAGAASLAQSIAAALDDRPTNGRGVTLISLNELRNYSRAGAGEFRELLQRLSRLLSHAGRDSHIEFIVGDEPASESPDARPHYRVQGAAYLITADGFDQWELFLSIAPIDFDMTVWDARSATRVLRFERPGATQIICPVSEGRGPP